MTGLQISRSLLLLLQFFVLCFSLKFVILVSCGAAVNDNLFAFRQSIFHEKYYQSPEYRSAFVNSLFIILYLLKSNSDVFYYKNKRLNFNEIFQFKFASLKNLKLL